MDRRIIQRITVGWLLLTVLIALLGRVSVAAPDAGRSAADFLRIGIGADAAGMGEAFSAVASGARAASWNPAGLPLTDRPEVQLTHFSWYQDVMLENASMAFPLNPTFSLGGSFTFVNYGTIKGYDVDGNYTEDLNAQDWAGGVSLGVRINDRFSAGATVKYISQKLDYLLAGAVAGDVGLRYETDLFAFSAVAANLGQAMQFESVSEKLPTSYRLGVAFMPWSGRLLASAEIDKKALGDLKINQGLQYTFLNNYYVRGGVSFQPSQDYRSLGNGVTFGAGVDLSPLEIDYAFTPQDTYTSEPLHRFSVLFSFGGR